ncbi:MAG: amidohydrolase family protein [Methylobacteriaceae bacterium]|nr:amidohydrolase family protein [Methylobacteriaceae bacterium]
MEAEIFDLVVAGGRLANGAAVDLGIASGTITTIVPAGTLSEEPRVELDGALILPGLIDGHIHLDKTLLGLPWIPHVPGASVRERLQAEKALRRSLPKPMVARARRLVELVVTRGTLALRSHVDIDQEIKLAHLEALLRLREEMKEVIDIQLVAFPQSGVTSVAGAAYLLDAALAAGADLLGGLDPAGIDGDIEGQLDILFRLAAKHGVGLDIHLHDPGELGAYELRRIAERTRASGLGGKVAVSHAFALGAISDAAFGATADALASADVAIMTNGPGAEPRPPVTRLAAAGVTVFAGSDNIRDAWSPYGNGDMLERARHIGYLNGLKTDAELEFALDLVTGNAARVLAFGDCRLVEGGRADLIAVAAANAAEAVAASPPRQVVIKAGRIVARNGQIVTY